MYGAKGRKLGEALRTVATRHTVIVRGVHVPKHAMKVTAKIIR
jgi:hypothetical protein